MITRSLVVRKTDWKADTTGAILKASKRVIAVHKTMQAAMIVPKTRFLDLGWRCGPKSARKNAFRISKNIIVMKVAVAFFDSMVMTLRYSEKPRK